MRTQNDRLLSEGTLVASQVVDIDRSSRGPDTMHVTFEWEGELLEYSIGSHWFQGWNRDLEGGTIAVLYDPAHPGFIRLPEQRNFNRFAPVLALLGPALVLAVASAVRQSQRALTAAASANWFPRTVAAKKEKRVHHLLVESTPGTLTTLTAGGMKTNLDPAPGWAVRHDQLVVALHEPSETVMIAGLTKRAATDQLFLNTPET